MGMWYRVIIAKQLQGWVIIKIGNKDFNLKWQRWGWGPFFRGCRRIRKMQIQQRRSITKNIISSYVVTPEWRIWKSWTLEIKSYIGHTQNVVLQIQFRRELRQSLHMRCVDFVVRLESLLTYGEFLTFISLCLLSLKNDPISTCRIRNGIYKYIRTFVHMEIHVLKQT